VKRRYWLVLILWLALVLGLWVYLRSSQQSVPEVLTTWLEALTRNPYSIVLLFLGYLLRPILLLPITLLTVFTGFLYGPIWGTLYSMVAMLASSSVAYILGRFFGGESLILQNAWAKPLRERSFETVLTSRLIFLPGDLVNYACGFLNISFVAFLLATALGGLPGLLVGVLAGASIEGPFSFSGIKINFWYVVISFLLLIISLAMSNYLRKASNLNK
jgi:uncharacterized membrane protein YdjX (TVP38/TMEM64 family)